MIPHCSPRNRAPSASNLAQLFCTSTPPESEEKGSAEVSVDEKSEPDDDGG